MQPIIGYNLGACLFCVANQILTIFGGSGDAAFMQLGRYGLRITVITFPLAAVVRIYPQVILLPMFFGIKGMRYVGSSADVITNFLFDPGVFQMTKEEYVRKVEALDEYTKKIFGYSEEAEQNLVINKAALSIYDDTH